MLEFLLPRGLLDGDPPSWYAVVRPDQLHAPSYDGKPRCGAEGAEPRILIMEAGGESDVFVSQYAEDLGYLTDSWYPTREAAIQDCEAAFGDQLGTWQPIPEGESHPEGYVLRRLASQ